MSYDQTIRSDDEAAASIDELFVESLLERYPGTRRLSRN